jgi:hypothetical protein
MEMSLVGYTPYPATLAVGSSALPIHLVAFGAVAISRWEPYQATSQS